MKALGFIITIFAVCLGGFALLAFDVSVASGTGSGRVVNLGLMQTQQSMIMVAGIAAVVGVILIVTAPKDTSVLVGDPKVFSAVARAIHADNAEQLRELMRRHGLAPSTMFPSGTGFLQNASMLGSTAAVKVLMEAGADPHLADRKGQVALNVARYEHTRQALLDIQVVASTSQITGSSGGTSLSAELERLAQLRAANQLTEAEFETAKAKLLA